MQCKNNKCRTELVDGAVFCHICGRRQVYAQTPKRRGNGQGTAYRLKSGKCRVVLKTYYLGEDKKMHIKSRSKSGFATKRDALDYLPILKISDSAPKLKPITWKALYDTWQPTHDKSKSTMDCYASAMKHFQSIWHEQVSAIDIDDLQDCVDDCEKGRRTKENMKALAGLLYKYGIPRRMVPDNLNLAQFIKVTGDTGHKDALTDAELKSIEKSIGKVKYADYVFAQCYLGFRPSEFLALDAAAYIEKEKAFVGGAKTDAGKDRVVTVSPKIQSIVTQYAKGKKAGPVFCDDNGKAMLIRDYRSAFYAVLDFCGIDNPVSVVDGKEIHRLTPHCCRHTFATLMKRVPGSDKDKLELIGHTSTEMLRHYQDVSFEDLRKITDAI